MKIISVLILYLLLIASVSAQNHQVDWYVIASGGGHTESGAYQVDGTLGQAVVGETSSDNYTVEAGYWVGAGPSGPEGYEYLPGDVNMYNGTWPPASIGGDVTYLVNYFRGIETSISCLLGDFWCSADANGDCNIIGSDVTRLVNYFRGQADLLYCADYEPAWHDASELPPSAPSGWPNCEGAVVTSTGRTLPGD